MDRNLIVRITGIPIHLTSVRGSGLLGDMLTQILSSGSQCPPASRWTLPRPSMRDLRNAAWQGARRNTRQMSGRITIVRGLRLGHGCGCVQARSGQPQGFQGSQRMLVFQSPMNTPLRTILKVHYPLLTRMVGFAEQCAPAGKLALRLGRSRRTASPCGHPFSAM